MTDSAQTRAEGDNTVVTVADVRAAMDAAYPPALAESWDKVGLICGDPQDEVRRIALALDCTDEVADRAIASGAQMLVVHHPLLLRGVNSVAADTPKGRILHKLIRAGVALFAAHTNADSARPGVNDQLATVLGVEPGAPLAPQPAPGLDTWTVKVPADHVDKVAEAMFEAGAGTIGDYDSCAFRINGHGQFRPLSGANPFIGAEGEIEYVEEVRLEMVAPRSVRLAIVKALLAAHPYEEPAFDIVDNQATGLDPQQAVGIGRVGTLDTPMPFKDFVARVAERLPATAWGVRGAGDPERMIRTVAVASGSGDSFLDTVAKMGVDAFVTSDLRHHPVDETLRTADFCVVDTAHWASEFPWCYQAADMLAERLGVATEVLEVRTDPWTVAESSTQARK
ncbi:Nif3-like dinuclear metal center hexameric protein [Corynebacterium amycolatum]|uniref:Nif3-like dinuclear metal center hexameric protein n=1 Tax=Corynebacterium amycolatum TaxID=43765 RepID=UPI00211A711D|nr:Nif3-like dinuclear metal center hexameric protein [Corynebacterium amycolatum]MCQ9170638.1 Nif3-like dinuclear metal center hexameric protein [Corynebacterium amycolatum]MCQ9176699.1 Nif3-like dinuclear metal center hexameric protein [Corynebacterium amycolatum]